MRCKLIHISEMKMKIASGADGRNFSCHIHSNQNVSFIHQTGRVLVDRFRLTIFR